VSDVGPPQKEWRSLDSYERRTKAFVVRVWVEQREIESKVVIWRGVIEVVTGQRAGDKLPEGLPSRLAFASLEQMNDFMVHHLTLVGIPEERLRPPWWTRNESGQSPE
jgi:hypothetical protein